MSSAQDIRQEHPEDAGEPIPPEWEQEVRELDPEAPGEETGGGKAQAEEVSAAEADTDQDGGEDALSADHRQDGDEAPGDETDGDETPSDETAGDETPGNETPGDEAPGDEAPGEEAPGEEAPGEEAPGEEAPGEEAPGEEAPGNETAGPPGLDAAAKTGEMKIVIDVGDGKTAVGVIRPGADAHLEMLPDDDVNLLAAKLPGIVARAEERWCAEPMRPEYTAPKKTPAKTPAKKAAIKPRTEEEPVTVALRLEPEQPTMNRLF